MKVKGVASAPQLAQRTLSGPMPSTRVCGHSVPQPGQTGAQYGSPLKRPSIGRSLPELVAIEVTSMSRMRIAMASPTSAPATATGVDTSWPPRIDGVIIGPQQPGRRVDDDVAAVGHRPGHRDVGPQQAVGEGLDEDRAVGLVAVGGVWVAAMRGLLRSAIPRTPA